MYCTAYLYLLSIVSYVNWLVIHDWRWHCTNSEWLRALYSVVQWSQFRANLPSKINKAPSEVCELIEGVSVRRALSRNLGQNCVLIIHNLPLNYHNLCNSERLQLLIQYTAVCDVQKVQACVTIHNLLESKPRPFG